ncbi:MAG: AMP-binding protein [Planctomycetes bacterium]|nr:AMP-binding protein [Planctomycetota bacterium]
MKRGDKKPSKPAKAAKTSTKAEAKAAPAKPTADETARPTRHLPPSPRMIGHAPTARPTDHIRVRARYTDPLRAANEFQTTRDLIQGQAARHDKRTFLIFEDDGREFSFADVDEQTTRAANLFHALGANPGARIALVMDNSPDYVFAYLGVLKGGFVAVPINPETSKDELHSALEDSGSSIAVVGGKHLKSFLAAASGLAGLQEILVSGPAPADAGISVIHDASADGDGRTRAIDFTSAMRKSEDAVMKTQPPRMWDEAQIAYTGSSTGILRGAILQQRQFITNSRHFSIWMGINETSRIIGVLPLFHVNAQVTTLLAPLVQGASVVLAGRFSAARLWKSVERYKVTLLPAVPTILGILTDREVREAKGAKPEQESPWPAPSESVGCLRALSDKEAREQGLARGYDLSSLTRVISGAAPLPVATQLAFEKTFLKPVIEGYSMAETTCFAALSPVNGTRKIGSVGMPSGDKVAIQDDAQPPSPLEGDWTPKSLTRANPTVFPTADFGKTGEICVWGENVLKEYHQRPAENPRVFAGGWFHTGDFGRMDADGFLYVLGRKEDQITRNGKTMAPREVDEALFRHPAVESAVTVGTPGPDRDESVTTWVILRKGTFDAGKEDGRIPKDDGQRAAMEKALGDHLSRYLNEHKRPTRILFASKLPQGPTGKTRILELRDIK